MINVETGVNAPVAFWILPEERYAASSQTGDQLQFLAEGESSLVYAPLQDELRTYFNHMALEIDLGYGNKKFDHMVDDALFLNTLLDLAILKSKPRWNSRLLTQFETPMLEANNLEFTGWGNGGSFRAAISGPEQYTVVAKLHKKLFRDLPDMMDIDRKLPLSEPLGSLLENRVLPALLNENMLAGHIFEKVSIKSNDKDIVFCGIMELDDEDKPQTMVTVRHVRYVHKSVLEIRLSDISDDPLKLPDFTIHLTDYERDFRVGPQMSDSMNGLIPTYFYPEATEGYTGLPRVKSFRSSQWIALPIQTYLHMQADFVHPENIKEPKYQTIEEAVHAGLRAIAEKTQHLGAYRKTNQQVPLGELLYGDWWVKYKTELLSLFQEKKTEQAVFGRENKFLTSEIVRLFTRLNDYDSQLFLRMAVPLGIMDVLVPEFGSCVEGFGKLIFGENFSIHNTVMTDVAVTVFYMRYPSPRARVEHELYTIKEPNLLGSQVLLQVLDAYRKQNHSTSETPLSYIMTWLFSAGPYKIER